MIDVDEIRRENLRAEAKRLGGDAALARAIGKDKNQVFQWIRTDDPTQKRTMRSSMARLLEIRLNRPQHWLDVVHAAGEASPTLSPDVVADVRPKNNVRALRFAVQSLFSVLHERMPDMAVAVAQDIVETAGKEWAGQGTLNVLVGILRGDDGTSEAVEPEVQQAPSSSGSRRVASATRRS